jgi:hypothetical protein
MIFARAASTPSSGPRDRSERTSSFSKKQVLFGRAARSCRLRFAKAVLCSQVVPGQVMAEDFKSGEVMTIQGSPLSTKMYWDLQVNGAHVSRRDITASNGVIHVIDAVIMPNTGKLLAAAA